MENWTPRSHHRDDEPVDSSSQDWVNSQNNCILASHRGNECSGNGSNSIKGSSFALIRDFMLEAYGKELNRGKYNYICNDCLKWFEEQLRSDSLRSKVSLFDNTHVTFDTKELFHFMSSMESLIKKMHNDFNFSYFKLLSGQGMEYQSSSSGIEESFPIKMTDSKNQREQMIRTLTVLGVDESEQLKILDRLMLVRTDFRQKYREISNEVIQETEMYQKEYCERMIKSLEDPENPVEISVDGR